MKLRRFAALGLALLIAAPAICVTASAEDEASQSGQTVDVHVVGEPGDLVYAGAIDGSGALIDSAGAVVGESGFAQFQFADFTAILVVRDGSSEESISIAPATPESDMFID